jgi:hypothetical protein
LQQLRLCPAFSEHCVAQVSRLGDLGAEDSRERVWDG